MKLDRQKIMVLDAEDPLNVSSSLNLTGGSAAQFFDGTSYSPDREGPPGAPVMLAHNVYAVKQSGQPLQVDISTLFYENDVLITASTNGYALVGANGLRVQKNIPGGSSAVIKAVSKFLEPDSGKVYERQDTVTLRTVIKPASQYQLNLSRRGVVYFDGYRNPNTATTVTAFLKKDGADLADYSGIVFKWLNAAGLDVVENELYADAYSNGNRTLTVDKTYIDKELIRCEAWQGSEMIAFNTVTFVRRFNPFRVDVTIPELPLQAGVNTLNCSVMITDTLGNVDVDSAFLVAWIVSEGGAERQMATGASVSIPVSSINMKAANLMIYPDLKRREAFAALTTDDPDELLTDDDDNVLTVETFGN